MTSANPLSQTRSPAGPPSLPAMALLTAALLCVGAAACASTSNRGGPTSRVSATATASGSAGATPAPSATPAGGYLRNDADDDGDDRDRPIKAAQNDDSLFLATYGKRASQADERAITALVKRYYATAAAGDGANACPLLYSTLAAGLTEGRDRSPRSGGESCAAVVSRLLEPQREQLAAEDVATMVVVDVRVKGTLGLAALGFRTLPMGTMLVKRERGAWKIDALFGSEMT